MAKDLFYVNHRCRGKVNRFTLSEIDVSQPYDPAIAWYPVHLRVRRS
ncbi:MAG: hypothetical protein Pars92KO_26570 [Parasphingorhabdus sp.]